MNGSTTPEERPRAAGLRGRRLAVAAGLLSVFPVLWLVEPFALRDSLPLCPFRCVTGRPCPLCGITRAVAMATHGLWRQAFRMNPLWPLSAAALVIFAALLVADAATGRSTAARLLETLTRHWLWLFVPLCAYGVVRILAS